MRNNPVRMWKDDDRSRPLIPKGKPRALQINPSWCHVHARCCEHKEVIDEDAHDANQKKMGFVVVYKSTLKLYESSC